MRVEIIFDVCTLQTASRTEKSLDKNEVSQNMRQMF